jgi:predicted dienelactone hydrolase
MQHHSPRLAPLFALIAVAGLTFGACSQASSGGSTATTASGSAAQAPAGARAASIDACQLLTKSEMQREVGVAVGDGKLQTTNSQATCEWAGGADQNEVNVSVNVQDFDQDMWKSFSSMPRATPVSGLGEAAFANVPTAPCVMIRQGKYEIDVAVVNFKMSNDTVIAHDKALAALVLPRLPK